MPLFSFLLSTLLAFTSAQGLITVGVDLAGSTCSLPGTTSIIVYQATYSQFFQSAGEIININGGTVTINNAPTTVFSVFETTITTVVSVFPTQTETATITIATDENGNTFDPNTRTTSGGPSATTTTGAGPSDGSSSPGTQPTGTQPTGTQPTSDGDITSGGFSTTAGPTLPGTDVRASP